MSVAIWYTLLCIQVYYFKAIRLITIWQLGQCSHAVGLQYRELDPPNGLLFPFCPLKYMWRIYA